ncbi:MAG: aldose epimerase family protein [Anaeromyxobacter sp.]
MAQRPTLERRPHGTLPDGTAVDLYTLEAGGLAAEVSTFGGAVVSLRAPDRDGRLDDVVLGYPTLDGYRTDRSYLGALIGRYGNRIGQGRFLLDGQVYQLPLNDGGNQLHGGPRGFDKAVWEARPFTTGDVAALELRLQSPDGDGGFPGRLVVGVTVALGADGTLSFSYEATTDRPTPVNLTHHGYFNLEGEGSGDVLAHVLQLHARHITAVGPGLIPTGALEPVAGSPFDFSQPRRIGDAIDADHPQLQLAGGYDHNWILVRGAPALAPAARVFAPRSGRVLEVFTTEPGVQFYSGNFLDGSISGKRGRAYGRRTGFCLETQHFPDSPNQPGFPSTILRPGERYATTTVYRFGVEGRG